MIKPRILIVDDDEEIRTQMKWALTSEYEVILAENRPAALAAFCASRPEVTMLDLGLPPQPASTIEGMATLAAILAEDRDAKVIIISGQGDRENAVQAVGIGAADFLCKPVEIDELKVMLRRCISVAGLEKEYFENQNGAVVEEFEGMVGRSPLMQAVFSSIRKVAVSPAPVLILGKSGTGKEMASRAIHRCSARREGPFVAINCNAIPESLMESELFGYEKGAFTGAASQRKGHIESAAGGTLFLDEIGELPAAIQVKLLRFLQEKTIQRVGGRQELEVDARVVAATNADLRDMVRAGTFREDLYYRLNVVPITLPALNERGEDILLVAREFLKRFARQNGKKGLTFSPPAVDALMKYSWPGNIRELQNRVQRAVIMADGKRIGPADLELEGLAGNGIITLREAREKVERELITAALQRNQGKVSAAATELGITRPTFYELLEKLGIARE